MTMGSRVILRAALVVVVELMACRPPVPPVPGQGGPPWIEWTSPHFTIWTDAEPARVHEIIIKMERLRSVLVHVAFPTAPKVGRGLAIVLRDGAELRAFSETAQERAFAVPAQSPLWQPLIVLSPTSERRVLESTLAHELVHAISDGVIHHQPRWFAEGMATYFESAKLDPELDTVEIGRSPTGAMVNLPDPVPIAELFGWKKMAKEEHRQYMTAWALFWLLVEQHETELQRYAQLMAGVDAESERRPDLERRIWDLSFPTLPLTTVDRTLKAWGADAQTYVVKTLTLRKVDYPTTERRLGDADVYAIRALLHYSTGTDDARARADVAAARALEPTHVLARLLAMELDQTAVTADDARAIAGAHEDDWRAWLLVAMAPGQVEEARAARARACEIAAANPALSPPRGLCGARRADPRSP